MVEDEFLPSGAIVAHDRDGAPDADQQLRTLPVGVLTANFLRGHIEHHEAAERPERQAIADLSCDQAAPHVFDQWHAQDLDAGGAERSPHGAGSCRRAGLAIEMVFATRERVVGKGDVGPHEDIVLDGDAVPELDAALVVTRSPRTTWFSMKT
jgi:hypothetical protein